MKNLDQNKFNIQLGAVVRKLRDERELSRLLLSEISGVNEKYIGKIERGESSPSCFVINKIALALKINMKDIFNKL